MTGPQPSGERDRRHPQALLLTGGLGAGKTSVALAVGEALEQAAVPGVVMDLDWLCWAWGPQLSDDGVHELLCRNVAAVVPNLLAAGAERLVLARGLLHSHDLDALREALGTIPLTVVRLTVSEETARTRLQARDDGQQLAEHLAELENFETQVRDAAGDAPVVDTTTLDPAGAAVSVLRLARWA